MKKIFTKDECNSIIDFSENINEWETYKSERNSYKMVRFTPTDSISEKIIKYCNDEINLNVSNVNIVVLKYESGDFFGRHYDRNINSEFHKDFVYNINTILNDDYEWGQFYLKDSPLYSNVGDVYHYKSTSWHEVKPVISGIRYSALFYIRERDLKVSKII